MELDLYFQCYRAEFEAKGATVNISLLFDCYERGLTVCEAYDLLVYLPF